MKKILQPSVFWLFIFAPIAWILDRSGARDPLIFFTGALAIIPIAKLISTSTENLAHYTGDSIGGLLNATFGNLPELIISIVAIRAGLYEMVLASIIGAILANLLLAIGVSFLLGGLKYKTQEFNPRSIRVYNTMMFIAVLSLVVPSSFSRLFGSGDVAIPQETELNVGLSIVLLILYVLYLVFMIGTHPDFFKSETASSPAATEDEEEKPWSLPKSILFLVLASVLAAFMSELVVGAAEGTGEALHMSSVFIGLIFVAIIGGAAESLSAINMARKNKMDLTISIALGSCIQISLFIAPLLVLLSFVIGPEPLLLSFDRMQLGAVFFAVLMATLISGDGQSNWYKGIQLLFIYAIMAIMFYFIPL